MDGLINCTDGREISSADSPRCYFASLNCRTRLENDFKGKHR